MNLYDTEKFKWDHYQGESLGKVVDYSGAVIAVRDETHIDVLYRWAPNSYCHFHRHIAPISSIVLEGEFHVYDYEDGKQVGHRIRKPGDYSQTSKIEDHIEQGGPNGALVIFSLYSPDGILTQRLSDDGEVLQDIRLEDVQARHLALI